MSNDYYDSSKGCPDCRYEDGVLVKLCRVHQIVEDALPRIQAACDEVDAECVALDAVCQIGRESLHEPMTI